MITPFLDLRLRPVGGDLASAVSVNQTADGLAYTGLNLDELIAATAGRHLLLGTHGFNVNRAAGIAALHNWHSLLQIPEPFAFVGVLWPGDSIWAHGIDYPEEPRIADESGRLLAPFLDSVFPAAASLSLASHSLGARVILSTIAAMKTPVRRAIIMAGAVDDNCLDKEFATAAANIGQISALASKGDSVLSAIFPLGNFFGGILTQGHPWWRAALGHTGPTNPRPDNFLAPFQIPASWKYKHSSYLEIDAPLPQPLPLPVTVVPESGSNQIPKPNQGTTGWSEAFSAAFVSTRFR